MEEKITQLHTFFKRKIKGIECIKLFYFQLKLFESTVLAGNANYSCYFIDLTVMEILGREEYGNN